MPPQFQLRRRSRDRMIWGGISILGLYYEQLGSSSLAVDNDYCRLVPNDTCNLPKRFKVSEYTRMHKAQYASLLHV